MLLREQGPGLGGLDAWRRHGLGEAWVTRAVTARGKEGWPKGQQEKKQMER